MYNINNGCIPFRSANCPCTRVISLYWFVQSSEFGFAVRQVCCFLSPFTAFSCGSLAVTATVMDQAASSFSHIGSILDHSLWSKLWPTHNTMDKGWEAIATFIHTLNTAALVGCGFNRPRWRPLPHTHKPLPVCVKVSQCDDTDVIQLHAELLILSSSTLWHHCSYSCKSLWRQSSGCRRRPSALRVDVSHVCGIRSGFWISSLRDPKLNPEWL